MDTSLWVGFVRMMVRERHIMSFSLYKTIRQASSQRRKVEWWIHGAGEEACCVGPIKTADGYTRATKTQTLRWFVLNYMNFTSIKVN